MRGVKSGLRRPKEGDEAQVEQELEGLEKKEQDKEEEMIADLLKAPDFRFDRRFCCVERVDDLLEW